MFFFSATDRSIVARRSRANSRLAFVRYCQSRHRRRWCDRRSAGVPVCSFLVKRREGEYAALGETRSRDHQSDGQTLRRKSARYGDRGDAVDIELAGVFKLRIARLVGLFSLERRIDCTRGTTASREHDNIDILK